MGWGRDPRSGGHEAEAAASRLYAALAFMEDKQEVEKIRTSLREYCELDTFAMARVLGKLRNLLKAES